MTTLPYFVAEILIIVQALGNSIAGSLPQRTSAVFYEFSNKSGYAVSYRESPLGWSNLQRVFQKKVNNYPNNPPQWLCATGVWLIYPQPGYKSEDNEFVNLISGKDNCVNPSDLGPIGAMQPITSSNVRTDNSISVFSKPNFGSVAHTISEIDSEKGGLKQLEKDDEQIGSIIVTGDKSWSLMSTGGKLLCVRPQPSGRIQSTPICYGKEMVQIEDFQVNAVFPDCPPEHDPSLAAVLKLTNCKDSNTGVAEPLKTTAAMGRTLGGGGVLECQYNITWNSKTFTEEESALIARLLTVRLTHDFENAEQILWPDAREDIWKTGPLDTAFDIIVQTIPGEIVNKRFLMMIREFTVFHLNEVWQEKRQKGAKMADIKSWRAHKVLVHLMNKCLTQATNKRDYYTDVIKTSYNERTSLADFDKKIHSDLVFEVENDPIIEIAWVVSNYVMALCHNAFEYKINFWDNFVTSFGHLYFGPLEKRWKHPTILSPRISGVILSGFGIASQHRRIAFAASRMLDLTPNLQPFDKNVTFNNVPW